ncbi:unnamed protein product [Caenorhabditis auriculariae]|uniref:Uncharacterized protein n=1 Tax=Caenorhabditis auriculariae TaxID=2777116 RepID=A0A8S1H4R9_9PELO|nr:unnamed protein product [Caenorhabditis auriculariae]
MLRRIAIRNLAYIVRRCKELIGGPNNMRNSEGDASLTPTNYQSRLPYEEKRYGDCHQPADLVDTVT